MDVVESLWSTDQLISPQTFLENVKKWIYIVRYKLCTFLLSVTSDTSLQNFDVKTISK